MNNNLKTIANMTLNNKNRLEGRKNNHLNDLSLTKVSVKQRDLSGMQAYINN